MTSIILNPASPPIVSHVAGFLWCFWQSCPGKHINISEVEQCSTF